MTSQDITRNLGTEYAPSVTRDSLIPLFSTLRLCTTTIAPFLHDIDSRDLLGADLIEQMMFVSGETADVAPETTSMIEGIVQQQVMEMVLQSFPSSGFPS